MDVTGDDELGELAKNGEVINLMANCGETSVLQVELTFCLRYLFCHVMSPLALEKLYYSFLRL